MQSVLQPTILRQRVLFVTSPWLQQAFTGLVIGHGLSPYVSESDILGPNGNLSDIKNVVSFERELFKDSSYKYRIKIFLLSMSISTL